MVAETTHQRNLIKAVKAQGGWGKKWSTQYNAGVPDLILSMPDFGLFLAEVKKMPDVPMGFRRQIETTEMQEKHLREVRESGGLGMVLVVLDNGAFNRRVVAVPEWETHLACDDLFVKYPFEIWPHGSYPNMRNLVRNYISKGYKGDRK